ncbi:MAG: glycosyltransferase family 2 protein [Candidatus Chisholmbacteria bacterium]|nr:glycosyltransferase family 2 protein [Candidatus Chisholmbacteria bacterium]
MANPKAKIIVVMPAYNAERTLKKTVAAIPKGLVSQIIVVDDGSQDSTVSLAKKMGLTVFTHPRNLGYGGNQKTCYWEALKANPEVVVMLHPDYQYDASLTGELVRPIVEDRFDVMFGSRIRTRDEALAGGMPLTKYLINRLLTPIENVILGVNFSEHLSGFRAYSRKVLGSVPFQRLSDDFVFDQQFMASAIAHGFRVGEIPVPVRYYHDSSSIQFLQGSKFLFQTGLTLVAYVLHHFKIAKFSMFE